MLQLWKVFVVVALASLFESASARRSLRQFCTDLSLSAASNQDVYTSPQVDMKEALTKLTAWSNVGMGSRAKLAKAWEVVVSEDEPCNSKSAHHVAIIARCEPENHAEMSSLAEATRKYTNRCLTPDFWDERLKKALAGIIFEDKSCLKAFVDDKFIEQYRADNPREKELPFDDKEECCKPWLSSTSLYVALRNILDSHKLERAINNWVKSPNTLDHTLYIYLFWPCKRYMESTFFLMERVRKAARYYKDGSEAFFSSLSPEFRNGIFRYRYCEHFAQSEKTLDKMGKIGVYELTREVKRQKIIAQIGKP